MSRLPSLSRLLENFFRLHLVARRNLSEHTIRSYRDAIVFLLQFAASKAGQDVARLEFEQLCRDVVLTFLDDLETTRRNSVRTRNVRLAAIHSFFRFVAAEEPACAALCREILGIPFKRRVHAPVTCLDRADIEHLLGGPDLTHAAGRRDAALLWFLYNTGARAQEVVQVSVADVRFASPQQVRLLGKGRKERICPLWPETVSRLRDMLRDRGTSEEGKDLLFLNYAARPLTRFGLRHIVRRYVALASSTRPSLALKHISPHTFRHTTALHLLQSGVEINVVRSWLGHASVQTTHEYIEIDLETKRAALESTGLRPRGGRRRRWQKPGVLEWLESL